MDRTTLAAFAAIISLHAATQLTEVPFYVFSLVAATSTVYIGSKLAFTVHDKNDDRYGKAEEIERLSRRDVAMFPIVGSCALLGIYVCVKYFSEYYLNLLARGYFALVGTFVVAKTLSAFLPVLLPASMHQRALHEDLFQFDMRKLPLSSYFLESTDGRDEPIASLSWGGLATFLASMAVAAFYFQSNHWMLANILAVCFSIQALIFIDVGSYKNGALLLCALFVYDIFWVFGTDVMVTVATSFDVPIKLLFPRGDHFALLGLGDIVLPGLFVALMARFDAHMYVEKMTKVSAKSTRQNPPVISDANVPTPYFLWTLCGYAFGLAFTLFINVYFEAPQPALLYLVPGVLLTSLACGVARGELSKLFAYASEGEDDAQAKEAEKKDS